MDVSSTCLDSGGLIAMTRTLTKTGHSEPRQLSRRAGMVRSVGLDLVGPLVVYYLCGNAGMSEVWALVVAGTLPALGVLLDWLRWRTLEVLGTVVLGSCALGI